MSGIDERILAMKFDNKSFESNIQTSMSSLDKFEKKLRLDGAVKGLEEVDKKANSLTLAGLASGVESISNKFTALGIIGITALQNITTAAMNTGSKLVSALTIDPIKTGLQEYETQLNAVQTILANTSSKGTTLKEVNSALAELNTYADKTIYNFTEMTRNIGTFTAAGVDLKTSTAAIKGIANLAAVSGSNAQQASTAMYQLSQALSSGTVKLQDWNSVVNAGMGGQVFQDALKETARVHKVNIDDMIKKEGSFRETLQNGWLTSKILTETLAKFTGDLSAEQLKSMGYSEKQIAEIIKLGKVSNDAATKVKTFTQLIDTLSEAVQSGWAQSWQIIIGDFDEAKVLFTNMSDVLGDLIGDYSDARNKLLQGWADLGGRKALIDGFANAFDALISVIKPLGQAFSDVFPPLTAKNLYDATVAFKNLTANFKMGEANADKLKRTAKGLFSVVSIIGQALAPLGKYFDNAFGKIPGGANSVLSLTARLGDFLVRTDEMFKREKTFVKFFAEVETRIRNFRNEIGKLAAQVLTKLAPVFDTFKKVDLRAVFEDIVSAFSKLKALDLSGFEQVLKRLASRFQPLAVLGDIVASVFRKLGDMLKTVAPAFAWFGALVAPIFYQLSKGLAEFMKNLDFKKISDGVNVGMIALIALSIKNFMDTLSGFGKSGTGILDSIKGILDGVTGSLEAMQGSLRAKTLLTIAGAIAILAASVFVLATVDSAKLTTALTAITVLFIELEATMKGFAASTKGVGMNSAAIGLVSMSVAVLILASAVKKLEGVDAVNTMKGVGAIFALLTSLSLTAKMMQGNTKGLISAGIGLGIFAGALHILVGVVEKLGNTDVETLKKGLISVGVLCAELAFFLKVSNFDGMGIKAGAGLVLLAAALKILVAVVSELGAMKVETLAKGLASIAAILAAVSAFANSTSGTKNLLSSATALTIVGASLLIFAKAVAQLGSLSVETITKGLLAMAGVMIVVSAAMNSLPKDMLAKSIALVVVAGALILIGKAMEQIGSMSVETLVKSLLGMAGALIVVAAASNAMRTALPGAAAIFVVSAALAVLAPVLQTLGNMSWGEIGKGLLALAAVFLIFGVAGYALAPVVPVIFALSAAIALFGAGLLMAGLGVLTFSAGLAALSVAFGVAGASIVFGITAILSLIPMALVQLGLGIVALAGVIENGAPAIVAALVAVLVALLASITKISPAIGDAITALVSMIVDVLVRNVPKLVDGGLKLILAILKGIRDNIRQIVEVGSEVIINLLNGISNKLPALANAAANVIISFVDALAGAIRNNSKRMEDAGVNLATAILDGMAGGLARGAGRVAAEAAKMANKAFQAAKDALLSKSPSKKFMELGEDSDLGMALGVAKFSNVVEDAASDVAVSALDSMKGVLSSISSIVSGNLDSSPTIRPVLDMTGIQNGMRDVGGMFGKPMLNVGVPSAHAAYANAPATTFEGANSASENKLGGVSFTQYNYSPKPLSRLEIYRQTRNQVNALRGLLVT